MIELRKSVRHWLIEHLGGHIRVGPVTIYGFNAMNGALNWKTKRWGYVCFHPSFRFLGWNKGWYFYLSPNATPWASTFCVGPGVYSSDKRRAKAHRHLFGHGFNVNEHYDGMMLIKAQLDF
jgi:hypothetical protein